MTRAWLLGALVAGAFLAPACSDAERPSGAPDGSGGGGKAGGGPGGKAGSKNTDAGESAGGSDGGAGDTGSGGAGEGGAEAGEGGSAGSSLGGAGPEPIPPVGDPPLCRHQPEFDAGTLLPLSGAGDDLLQAVTPDERIIAWKNGAAFFVAERADPEGAFGAPLEVIGGSQYEAVSLSADGLVLVAVTRELSVVEVFREPGQAFDAANADAGDFEEFNGTFAGIPGAGKVLTDAVLSADGSSFFYSHFLSHHATGERATLYESLRTAGLWSGSSFDLGSLLYGNASQRRVPTGVSSDLLTLFYRDEVEGDFRAAWRINPQVPFEYSEVLEPGDGVQAAAPNSECSKLYFSAQGDDDLDLFVAVVTN